MFYCFSICTCTIRLVCHFLPPWSLQNSLLTDRIAQSTSCTVTNVLVVHGLFWLLLLATEAHTQNYKTNGIESFTWNIDKLVFKGDGLPTYRHTCTQQMLSNLLKITFDSELMLRFCDLFFYMKWWQLIDTNRNVCEVFDIDISYVTKNDTKSIATRTWQYRIQQRF